MEQRILSTPASESEIADFLLENPRLSKARIGEYIGDRKNAHILEAFVRYIQRVRLRYSQEKVPEMYMYDLSKIINANDCTT